MHWLDPKTQRGLYCTVCDSDCYIYRVWSECVVEYLTRLVCCSGVAVLHKETDKSFPAACIIIRMG